MGRIVTLKIYPTVEDAELAHQFLAENHLHTWIEVDQVSGGIKLQIDENDLEKAQDILQLVK